MAQSKAFTDASHALNDLSHSLALLEAENAKLRELVRELHMAHVGMVHRYKGSETATIWEWSSDTEYDMKRLESECEEECHRFDVVMSELGIEVEE